MKSETSTPHCAGCGSKSLRLLFSLGSMPPVNAFLLPEEISQERRFALDLYFCQQCTLVQLGESVDPALLFSHYLHVSSASQSNIAHLRAVAQLVTDRLAQSGSVLEIGSNDGTLLSFLKNQGAKVLGVDPAKNLRAVAQSKGVEQMADFFLPPIAEQIQKSHGQFDAVVALNVVAHTPRFVELLSGVQSVLKSDGFFMMEAAYVVDTILAGQFDTIYHEHVYCFSLHALSAAFKKVGLKPIHAEIIPTQGTSIRVFAVRSDSAIETDPSINHILKTEEAKGYTDAQAFAQASALVQKFIQELPRRVAALTQKYGRPPIALGAPARGVVMLNACKIGPAQLSAVIDDTSLKQGRLVPGAHIPVYGWDFLDQMQDPGPRGYLVLSWNYRKEILEKLRRHVSRGTVLIPFPQFEELTLG